jgi:hypothetical protein
MPTRSPDRAYTGATRNLDQPVESLTPYDVPERPAPAVLRVPAFDLDWRTIVVCVALLLAFLALVRSGAIPALRTVDQQPLLAPQPAVIDHSYNTTKICVGFQPSGC